VEDRVDTSIAEGGVTFILEALVDNLSAQRDFADGLDKCIHRLTEDPGAETQNALLRYIRNWTLDISLARDERWRASVAETRTSTGEPVTFDELRRAVLEGG
jgi:hypothetical protein